MKPSQNKKKSRKKKPKPSSPLPPPSQRSGAESKGTRELERKRPRARRGRTWIAGHCSRSEACSFACRGLLAERLAQLSHAERNPRPAAPWKSNHLSERRRSRLRVLPGEGPAPGLKDDPAFHPDRLHRRRALPAPHLQLDPFLLRQAPGDTLPLLHRRCLCKADAIKSTLAECEAPALADVDWLCVTSLESMVDFATASLGTHDLRALSTAVGREGTLKQAYTIESVKKMSTPGSELVACHGMKYAYAVFHCHTTTAAAYTVSMAGADGTRVEALAACHTDVAAGVEEAFKKLNVEPWSVPVCHFLPQDDLLWSRN
uniref:BURP domain-containing protein n=1 Tax=Ananas comosus var. bracteatus TaxID=296719 RepID=A0A6V7QJM2_ANACO|nr:unnamed protein product [Ananas comosus var. bracteatus]